MVAFKASSSSLTCVFHHQDPVSRINAITGGHMNEGLEVVLRYVSDGSRWRPPMASRPGVFAGSSCPLNVVPD
jgi:hypothetical protein